MEAEWIESLYSKEEPLPGKQVVLPWQGKGGKMQNWIGVVVSDSASEADNEKKVELPTASSTTAAASEKPTSSGEKSTKNVSTALCTASKRTPRFS